MDFADRIMALSARVKELRSLATTEEGTKTSLILPFLQTLGYDAFDPRVVVPEFTADVGTKKGEKVDYAVKRDGVVIMLLEAKAVGATLDGKKAGQLHRYFHNIESAKIGILTDGVVYQFFTDLERPNIMDEKPFMTFDFTAIEAPLVNELKKLCNDCFDVDIALASAQELKYLRQFKKLVAEELASPSDELVKLFAKQVHTGNIWANLLDGFRERIKTAFEHHVNDIINARLQGAMQPNAYPIKPLGEELELAEAPKLENSVVTTEEEIEGYLVVKAILREISDPARVVMRDTMSYCGILLDDTNRKPICRLHFNAQSAKYIEIFCAEKKGTRHKIESLNDLYKYADQLKTTVIGFEAG